MNDEMIFLDQEMRVGGLYELSIQVSPIGNFDPIKLYTNYFWRRRDVKGPYNQSFSSVLINYEDDCHEGLVQIGEILMPVQTYCIRDAEPIDAGFNWFDISFSTSAIQKMYGSEYRTWTEKPNPPQAISDFFLDAAKSLYQIFPFRLAFVGFEVSGHFKLEDLERPIDNGWQNLKFYVGKNELISIENSNNELVEVIEAVP